MNLPKPVLWQIPLSTVLVKIRLCFASQEFSRFLWNPTVPYRISARGHVCVAFRNMLSLAHLQTTKVEDHPFSLICKCLFSIFSVTRHIWRPPPIKTCGLGPLWWQDPLNVEKSSCLLELRARLTPSTDTQNCSKASIHIIWTVSLQIFLNCLRLCWVSIKHLLRSKDIRTIIRDFKMWLRWMVFILSLSVQTA